MGYSSYWESSRLCDQVWNGKTTANCFYCNIKVYRVFRFPRGNVDHVVPKARGGTNALSNLVISCTDCNNRKGDRGALTFIFELAGMKWG